ncbi:MAG: hypothetical protein AAFR57_08190 [Pseudomonadota bacterium]
MTTPAEKQPAGNAGGADQSAQKAEGAKAAEPPKAPAKQPSAAGPNPGEKAGPAKKPKANLPATQKPAPVAKPENPARIRELPKPKVADAPPSPRFRLRHTMLVLSFLVLFLGPLLLTLYYLFEVSADQYHSTTAFSVRSEESSSPFDALAAFTQTGGTSVSDADVLYEFMQSQPLVQNLQTEIDLITIFNKRPDDWVFHLGENPTIEDLTSFWNLMVTVSYDSGSKLIEVEARAFTPEDAQMITAGVLAQGSALINRLSQVAREDTTRFARADLEDAELRMKDVRRQIREFRNENQIINPEADVQGQAGVIAALEARLADALVQRETLLLSPTRENDPRLAQYNREVEAIRRQIEAERQTVAGETTNGGRPLAQVIGEYEELLVDREFAETAYTAALAAYEQAKAEARRQSRYLAAHIDPTLSQEPQYPTREIYALLAALILLAVWGTVVLISYNVRDRR